MVHCAWASFQFLHFFLLHFSLINLDEIIYVKSYEVISTMQRHNVLTAVLSDIELYIPLGSGEQALSNGFRST